jgi:hypothetical protein
MLWDRAGAALKSQRENTKPPGQGAGRTVRATAAASPPSSKHKAQEASSRFAQTRTKDDAIALLNARGNG